MSSRRGKSVRWWAPRDSSRRSALATIVSATSSMNPSSRAATSSVLNVRLVSSSVAFSNRSRSSASFSAPVSSDSTSRKIPTLPSIVCCMSARTSAIRS